MQAITFFNLLNDTQDKEKPDSIQKSEHIKH